MITPDLRKVLEAKEFVSVATCDFEGHPNAVSKFLLKVERRHLYLVDYTMGAMWRNVLINPRVSISFVNPRTLNGYQMNGTAEIISKGEVYRQLRKDMVDKQIKLTAKHLIEDVRGEAQHENFEVVLPSRFIVFKIKITEVVEVKSTGGLSRTGKRL